MEDKFCYTVKEVAQLLSVSQNTVYRLIESKFIKAVKLESCIRITLPEIERILKS